MLKVCYNGIRWDGFLYSKIKNLLLYFSFLKGDFSMAKLKSGSHRFASEHGKEICKMLYESQIKYASGEVQPTTQPDGAHMIEIINGVWRYRNLWYGGEPFAGTTTIFMDDAACFVMQYRGRIMPYVEDKSTILAALMQALQHPVAETPWRGPHKFKTNDGLRYRNQWQGGLRDFAGTELITDSYTDETLYKATYNGIIVDKDG